MKFEVTRNKNTAVVRARDLLTANLFAGYKDKVRYYLHGVCFDRNKMLATDGHVAVKIEIDHFEGGHIGPDDRPIISFDASEKLFKAKAREELMLWIDFDSNLIFAFDSKDLSGNGFAHRLGVCDFHVADGDFPALESVIPEEPDVLTPVQMNISSLETLKKAANLLCDAVPAIRIKAGERGSPARIQFNGAPHALAVAMPPLHTDFQGARRPPCPC